MPVTCPNCGGPHPRWECKMPDVFVPEPPSKNALIRPPFKELTPTEFKAGYNAYMREYMRKYRAKRKLSKLMIEKAKP